ncbi:3'-5' exoribonuclease [Pullulanibacillus pueri]|uniref:3'-5' exoribonuclease YhaM n=1 Tax=Pullulanibacillus pueri TaxID=1437324 RepID=A0A8J2ZZU3_9BACL|nr:3'-5' exoribonuclease YhaM [Pullulanibacillus pueri]MBM7683423.1 3'-5' exoribonuclease [Pullulanibacillus pueri]GGH88084.1 3'-5' exoribonuclease YhaM [Pullulanibacillus pueri]
MSGITHCAEGDPVNHYLMIKSATRSVASNNKPFLTIILQDISGDIEAKLWDATAEDEEIFIPEAVVKVEGEITSFRGKKQLKIRAIRPVTEADNVNKSDLVPTAPMAIQDMMDQINQYIFEIQNPKMQRITRALVKKHQDAFFEYPAAVKNHHEYMSGLAYHVTSMLHLAKAIAGLYPDLDTDLLYAGIILHDMGKVTELSGPMGTSYTLEGKLLGHISIMANEIVEMAKMLEIEGEEVVILQHLILSHHSKGEWGSPKPPLVREAEILHMIDNLDAKLNMMNRSLEKVKPGEFTERLFAMDNRSFYKPSFEQARVPVNSEKI